MAEMVGRGRPVLEVDTATRGAGAVVDMVAETVGTGGMGPPGLVAMDQGQTSLSSPSPPGPYRPGGEVVVTGAWAGEGAGSW